MGRTKEQKDVKLKQLKNEFRYLFERGETLLNACSAVGVTEEQGKSWKREWESHADVADSILSAQLQHQMQGAILTLESLLSSENDMVRRQAAADLLKYRIELLKFRDRKASVEKALEKEGPVQTLWSF